MGMQAKITILSLYQWDNNLFNLLQLPEGIDKESLVSLLVTKCATLEILYPNPEVMKNLIGLWSIQSQYTWNKLLATITAEYNPIDNYDRTETRTNTFSAEGSSTDGGKDTTTSTDSGEDSQEIEGVSTLQVAGFNTPSGASSLVDKEKNSNDASTTTTYGKENETETTYGRTNNNTYDKTETETIRARGNIGTVTTQSMLEAERQIALFNIYDEIINDFKRRYCILVY